MFGRGICKSTRNLKRVGQGQRAFALNDEFCSYHAPKNMYLIFVLETC